MHGYVVLLRGINVGGKNKVPMASLRELLERLGYADVTTYIASGNVILRSAASPDAIRARIEAALPEALALDDELVKVLVLTRDRLRAVVENRPRGFGEHPEIYHSDAIFLIGLESDEVMPLFKPREGVDAIWPGDGVVYSQRLSAERTKSRLNVIMASPAYKSMTIRSWSTTTKLLALAERAEGEEA